MSYQLCHRSADSDNPRIVLRKPRIRPLREDCPHVNQSASSDQSSALRIIYSIGQDTVNVPKPLSSCLACALWPRPSDTASSSMHETRHAGEG